MSTSKLYDARKLFAVAVIIAFLATFLSMLGMEWAGQHAVRQGTACKPGELRDPMLLHELGLPLSLGDGEHKDCILDGLARRLEADNFFLISYSVLYLGFFLFLAAIGRARPPLPWILAGSLLALVMLSADVCENRYLREWIRQSGTGPYSGLLFTATAVKWGALAAASVLIGLIYLLPPSRVAKLAALPAFAAAALLGAGLYKPYPPWVNQGSVGLFLLWLCLLIHAITVAFGRGKVYLRKEDSRHGHEFPPEPPSRP